MAKYTIGVMIGNANSPHTIDTVNGIMQAAKKFDVNVINFIGVHSSYFYRDYFEREKQEDYDYQSTCVFEYDKLCQLDALIVSYGTMSVFMSERELKEFQRRIYGIPTIYLENKTENATARYIIADNYLGMKQIMEHMIKFHEYKKILYLSGPAGNLDADERLAAYMDSMKEASYEVTDSMIGYGDFSESVAPQINKLLDENPDAEALVCANDTMAITAYSVIKERAVLYKKAYDLSDSEGMKRYRKHIISGTSEFGIAISGYDNISDSANVDPPLSSVVQSPYSHGYMALKSVINLIENPEKTESILATPKLVLRQSCGCKAGEHIEFPAFNERFRVNPEQYASTVAEIYTSNILPVELNNAVCDEVYDIIFDIVLRNTKKFVGLSNKKFSAEDILEDTKEFLNGPVSQYIPRMTFVSAYNDFMMGILKNAETKETRDILVEAESKITEYVYTKLFSESKEDMMMYRHRTWFMPLISRDMVNNLDSLKDMYHNAVTKMRVLEIGDVYIFVTDTPVLHRRTDKWSCPKEMKLVAYSSGGEVVAYEPGDAPVVSAENVLNEYVFDETTNNNVSLLNLYSGEYQYGIIVAKTKPEDVLSLYCASLQISTSLKYCEMAREQRKTQRELHKIIQEVEDKNEILRSLSEYDQLTGCYNRRGFMERGLELIRQNPGREACIVFADLDHLKEINDKYGHSEGDFAIESIAKNIKVALPDSAILSRLGGDEFVALFLMSESMDSQELVRNITNVSVSFNAMSTKPYYIECSAGYSVFECKENTSIEDVMGTADEFLYEAKARRRKTIVKSVSIY